MCIDVSFSPNTPSLNRAKFNECLKERFFIRIHTHTHTNANWIDVAKMFKLKGKWSERKNICQFIFESFCTQYCALLNFGRKNASESCPSYCWLFPLATNIKILMWICILCVRRFVNKRVYISVGICDSSGRRFIIKHILFYDGIYYTSIQFCNAYDLHNCNFLNGNDKFLESV